MPDKQVTTEEGDEVEVYEDPPKERPKQKMDLGDDDA
jgi:hypothetical protein